MLGRAIVNAADYLLPRACGDAMWRNAVAKLKRIAKKPPVHEVKPRPSADNVDGPYLNLGCGWDKRPGWINIDMNDFHAPDIVADATRLSMVEDKYAGYALAQDILEHIHRDRCLTALQEWNRVLRMGGLLEVRTTDVIGIVNLMQQPENTTAEKHATYLQCMFGTQGYEGDFHLAGFTEIVMRDLLDKSGFEIEYYDLKDGWLIDVVARKFRHAPPERYITTGTDHEFLEEAYRRFLKRDPDPAGMFHWLKQLETGTPREVIAAIIRKAQDA